jgi:predicted DNA binding CopG/RHH family protein
MATEGKLDKEEQEILHVFEEGKLRRSTTISKDKATARALAVVHNRKDARINIRLSQFDLDRLKRIAVREGMPYQTLISSILHKYADSVM